MKYSQITSLEKSVFTDRLKESSSAVDMIITPKADLRKIENILDLSENILEGLELKFQKSTCECGRTLSFYDFVFTALVEQWHDSSFLVHTLLGRKYITNSPRIIRCSSCGSSTRKCLGHYYDMPQYGCSLECDAPSPAGPVPGQNLD